MLLHSGICNELAIILGSKSAVKLMRSIPLKLKYKLILAPGVLVIPVLFVIGLMFAYLNEIGEQNDTVREWADTTDQLTIAISSIKQLQSVVSKLAEPATTLSPAEKEELLFAYIEHSRLLKGSINHPVLIDKVEKPTLQQLQQQAEAVMYREHLDFTVLNQTFVSMLPTLENLYNSLQAQKRAIYIDSNEFIKKRTSTLATITVSVLGLCVILGVLLAYWITRSTTLRIRQLTLNANNVCDKRQATHTRFAADELDELALCLSNISNRMLNNLAAEKLLEGAEDERRRIAMDIHDQFLADLNHFKRDFYRYTQTESATPVELQKLQTTLDDLSNSLRGIIDDLHPQSLDMFGLEAAVRSYLDRKLSGQQYPEYYLHIATEAEVRLSTFQKLTLYRILLEAVTNIIRHAHCTRYEIDMHANENGLQLTVEDNGIGMELDSALKKGHHGLFNIMQRARSVNAELSWGASRFSSGTQMKLTLANEFLNPKSATTSRQQVSSHG